MSVAFLHLLYSFLLSLSLSLCEKAWKLSEVLPKAAAVITKESVTDRDPAMQIDQRSGLLVSITGFHHYMYFFLNYISMLLNV